ncbi:MAG: methyltransferase domain-containing protein [Gammaproteobacteria bacterium]
MNIDAIQKAYRRYAQVYDLYFGALFQPGRQAVIEKMDCRPGDRILEVGVGTGLSLPLYPSDVQVTGIDISVEMLERAKKRVMRENLRHVAALEVMDAEQMRFEDNSFDKVIAMYVASVVPHPVRLINEMQRVCKEGGELFIVNHFKHANPVIGGLESLIAPLSKLLGFRPDFSLPDFIRETQLNIQERSPVNLFGYWTLLRARNNKEALEQTSEEMPGYHLAHLPSPGGPAAEKHT